MYKTNRFAFYISNSSLGLMWDHLRPSYIPRPISVFYRSLFKSQLRLRQVTDSCCQPATQSLQEARVSVIVIEIDIIGVTFLLSDTMICIVTFDDLTGNIWPSCLVRNRIFAVANKLFIVL